MKSPRYTILLANRKTGVIRRVTFSRRVLAFSAVCACALPSLLAFGSRGASTAEVEQLRSANETLRLENDSYREATGELTTQITSLQAALTQIGGQTLDASTRAAVDAMATALRMKAAGGGAAGAPVARRSTETPERTFGVLRDLLGSLENRLASVRTQVESQQVLARATPSIWPVSGWLSSIYGNRKDPFTGLPDFHSGLDISTERGKPVRATADATVQSVGYAGNYGNAVLLNHGFGITTRFGHLSGFAVRVGQKVKRNDVIGFVGATGRATAPHLHYEILVNGQTMNPLNLLSRR